MGAKFADITISNPSQLSNFHWNQNSTNPSSCITEKFQFSCSNQQTIKVSKKSTYCKTKAQIVTFTFPPPEVFHMLFQLVIVQFAPYERPTLSKAYLFPEGKFNNPLAHNLLFWFVRALIFFMLSMDIAATWI
jgi:hypothetical protein